MYCEWRKGSINNDNSINKTHLKVNDSTGFDARKLLTFAVCNQILFILDTAISSIEAKSKPENIDWMGRATEATPSRKSKYSKVISNLQYSGKSPRI